MCFTQICSGPEAGSCLRLIDFVYHSALVLRAITQEREDLGDFGDDHVRDGHCLSPPLIPPSPPPSLSLSLSACPPPSLSLPPPAQASNAGGSTCETSVMIMCGTVTADSPVNTICQRQHLLQLLYINVQRFREGLVVKAHRLLYHSTLGLRVIKKRIRRPSVRDGDCRQPRKHHLRERRVRFESGLLRAHNLRGQQMPAVLSRLFIHDGSKPTSSASLSYDTSAFNTDRYQHDNHGFPSVKALQDEEPSRSDRQWLRLIDSDRRVTARQHRRLANWTTVVCQQEQLSTHWISLCPSVRDGDCRQPHEHHLRERRVRLFIHD